MHRSLLQAFDDCTTLSTTFKLLESFEGLLERDAIAADLAKKHHEMVMAFVAEVKEVHELFLSNKAWPLLSKNSPPHSGTLAIHCLPLLQHVVGLMLDWCQLDCCDCYCCRLCSFVEVCLPVPSGSSYQYVTVLNCIYSLCYGQMRICGKDEEKCCSKHVCLWLCRFCCMGEGPGGAAAGTNGQAAGHG
jgi:hypothetical protein